MKIMYINLLKKKNENKDEEVLMKDLREKKISDFFEEIKHKKIRNIHNNKNNKFFNKLKNFNNNNIVKKNQLTLFVLSLMLVAAGYMNYSNNVKKIKKARLGDATFVSTNIAKAYDNEESSEEKEEQQIGKNLSNDIEASNSQNSLNTIETSNNSNTIETVDNQNNSNTMETSKSISTEENENTAKNDNNQENQSDITDNYFASTRLERDKSYSQMLETYTNILKESSVPSDQKTIASNEIKKINDRKNQITTIENLLKGKEIEDSVVMINDNSIDVIVKSDGNLSKTIVAQIENIVSRELNSNIEDIHITTHK